MYQLFNRTAMYQFRFYFLFSSLLLIFMGAFVKLEGYDASGNKTFTGGIVMFCVFVLLTFRKPVRSK